MRPINKCRLFALCASTLYALAVGHPVLAEDTEVLVGPGGLAQMKPNVLFILDTSTSMAWSVDAKDKNSPVTGPSRLSIVQNVFRGLMEDPLYQGMNVALMRFASNGRGGYFVTPMQELNDSTRNKIINASRKLDADGNTPLAETLYEAARFWGGLSVGYDGTAPGANHPDVLQSNGDYISPISDSQCQKNYVILLTDGGPNGDNQADDDVSEQFLNGEACDVPDDGNNDGRCLDDIARYLNTVDQSPDKKGGIPGTQTVQTYTIGFTTDNTLLQQTATAGGGTYTVADNAKELKNAFTSILSVITNSNNSFSAPALAANTFNGVSHINRLYYTLFEPAAAPKWNGNVKPYELNDNYELVDANGEAAVDERGFFKITSRSFWSDRPDGVNIVTGGANDRLPAPGDRNLYTYTGGYDEDETGLVPDSPEISAINNALKNTDSSDLTAGMLNINITDANGETDNTKTDAEFTRVLNTIRNTKIGSPLHSQPVLVTYGGKNAETADLTLFFTTNDGFLHALNASPENESTAGKELFAFIPKELLPNLPKLASKTGSMVYGLDGGISVWVNESNDPDSTIEIADGDHVYVYIGMRRGGNNYYALDVTTRTAPTLKWVIRGGPGGTPGFEELGQSWSKPTLSSIKYGAETKKVLIFGGGYDTAQDDNPLNADSLDDNDDTIGRAIFIVDAGTGERLWWAGPTGSDADLELGKMTHSIPSDIRLLDSNRDGHTDRLYVGDMRGQIFRIDLKPTLTNSTGVLLASLSGDTEADNRRFYYPPDVVLTQRNGIPPYISINIGSGYRAHPLNPPASADGISERVNDRFYSLRDPYVTGPIPPNVTITPISDGSDGSDSNLFDATSNLVASSSDISALAGARGWYITLGDGSGEKVLAPSMTLNGEIFFTTYTPPAQVTISECGPQPGIGRLYRVSLFDATPIRNKTELSDSGTETLILQDRTKILRRPGIPPGPTAIFRKNGIGQCIGAKCEKIPDASQIEKTYWRTKLY